MGKATTVSEEALSNIRTVRAFAMEDKEIELYAAEVEKSRVMQESLGTGIAFFQVIYFQNDFGSLKFRVFRQVLTFS